MLVLSFCFGTLAARLSPGFICKFLYIYAVMKCIFMQYIMVNRKLCGNFGFSCMFEKRPILLLSVFSLLSLFWINYRKQKQKRKSRIFAVFAWKRPFLSQIKRWFSVIYAYIGWFTPHPPFLALAGWVSSRPNFFIFLFFLFL